MTDPRRITLDLRQGTVGGLEFGDPGRPLDAIFLHATGFNASTYRQGLAPLGEHIRVLAVDQRGHGLTTLPTTPTPRDWDGFADDLVEMMDALSLAQPVVLSGHSMGGTVSVLATPRLGDRVKGLVLFDPVMMRRPDQPPFEPSPLVEGAARRRSRFDGKAQALESYTGRGAFKSWPAQALADYVEDGFRPDEEGGVTLTCTPAWESAIFAAQASEPWAALDRIAAPVSVLRAEHGSTCLEDEMRMRVAGRPERSLVTIPGSSHFLPMERPDLVAEALLAACA
jgi:pimeloyl-ACP methyl ester carboxylesterase